MVRLSRAPDSAYLFGPSVWGQYRKVSVAPLVVGALLVEQRLKVVHYCPPPGRAVRRVAREQVAQQPRVIPGVGCPGEEHREVHDEVAYMVTLYGQRR